MPTDHRAALANIKSFVQLIAYLRDEMGWPIARDSFEDVDDLFYDFTAEELGIDPKTAAKITEIKRLRPLSTHQPWGIFFIKFEPKKLPVVALRRILSQVALKKRASANSAERTAWAADDLLFVSNYGEGEERQISFAHFAKAQDGHDLPTLKVLGWDNRDTALHLDAVAKELTQQLAWPDDEGDVEAWRKGWRGAFTLRHGEVISTAKELAIRLAELARAIRDTIITTLAIETERGPLTRLMTAFQEALVHDLDGPGFADMYAQTIAYGLLSARIADPHRKTADDFAAHMRTNPFLRELMEHFLHVGGRRGKAGGPGIDFDELGVSEVVELLDSANMEAVVRDFGDRNRQEDPVMHFYESFLSAYNKQLKIQRGVFYTPQPVVSYIVRSVHELLQTEFGLVDGLADTTTWGEMLKKHPGLKLPSLTDEPGEKRTISPDEPFIQILDPATGTATFPVEVIEVIFQHLKAKWAKGGLAVMPAIKTSKDKIANFVDYWNAYIPEHLLPRLHAFELMMAPYAIAHMKIGLKLAETGYRFGTEERARIYLTNALEPWVKQLPLIGFDALAHEAAAVNKIKHHKCFTVVIGNPPYAKLSSNRQSAAEALVTPFKVAVRTERNIQPLSDDYVKFLGFTLAASLRVPLFSFGMITNRGYLNGLIHRGVRQVLLENFNRLWAVDLHGDSNVGETAPGGLANENVFDIQQGVAITLGIKSKPAPTTASCYESWGTRSEKQGHLARLTLTGEQWKQCSPVEPHYFFQAPQRPELAREKLYSLGDAMPTTNTGIKTHRDDLVIDFDSVVLLQRIQEFLNPKSSDSEIRAKFFGTEASGKYQPGDNRDWKMSEARRAFKDVNARLETFVRELDYRPFDCRSIFYNTSLIDFAREDLMHHMAVGRNIGLIATRQVPNGEFCHVFVTRRLIEMKTGSHDRGTNLFPLYVGVDKSSLNFRSGPQPNYSAKFLRELSSALSLRTTGDHGLPAGLTPEDIFHYAYAVFHSPGYRSRYAEFLKIDFPRLPLTGSLELFRALARFGGELTALHLLESPKLAQPISEFIGSRHPEVEKVSWSRNTVWVDKAQTTGFHRVREEVWNFHIGGYQVCQKWLKDRKGRTLSKADIAHYHKIVVALNETIRLMAEIDQVIERHGGWPGAFASTQVIETDGVAAATATPENVVALNDQTPRQKDLYDIGDEPIREVADVATPSKKLQATEQQPSPTNPEHLDRDELLCLVRQLFTDGAGRERQPAIDEIARELGYKRTGPRIQELLDDTIRTAVRRGILENVGGALQICARSIEQYEREFLKAQFLASLGGTAWIERKDAIRAFARWLGFRRTGPSIDETARSLINGLIRAGKIESDGSLIRKAR